MSIKKTLSGYFKEYNQEKDLVRFIASSGAVDREGEAIRADGWVLDNFLKNPVLLWSHNAHELPIGKVQNVYTEGDALIAEVQFAEKENDFAKKVADLVKGGFLNAVSVGFMPLAYDTEGAMIRQELLELSVVNVPANQEALRSNEYQAFTKSLDLIEKKEVKVEVEVKTPACMMDGESKDECVARKIPEIKKENPEMSQEQCVAMAESMCSKTCVEQDAKKEEGKKEGRVISEKNRNTMRIAMESMSQASQALSDLLNQTEPPAKKGGVNKKQIENIRTEKDTRILKSVRLMDKIVEGIVHEIKEGGVRK